MKIYKNNNKNDKIFYIAIQASGRKYVDFLKRSVL